MFVNSNILEYTKMFITEIISKNIGKFPYQILEQQEIGFKFFI